MASATSRTISVASTVLIQVRVRVPKWRASRPLTIVVQIKVGRATVTAVRSMVVLGASQNPRKITLPVILATNTWPSARILIESANPVAKVNSSNAATVHRSDTGDVTAMRCSIFRLRRWSALNFRRQIQRRNRRHPGHQPAVVGPFQEQPVGQVLQRRDVLGQRAGRGRIGV